MAFKNEYVEQTGVGASAPIIVFSTNEVRVSYGVRITGTVTYSVEHSLGGGDFFVNSDTTGRTANADGNYIFPIESVRVNVTAGAGTARLYIMQQVV